jgi:hypothetical protein
MHELHLAAAEPADFRHEILGGETDDRARGIGVLALLSAGAEQERGAALVLQLHDVVAVFFLDMKAEDVDVEGLRGGEIGDVDREDSERHE